MRLTYIICISLALGFASCKKDNQQKCEDLKIAASTDNVAKVNAIITSYIASLPSQTYNEQNIQMLTERISRCEISSALFCFDCIKTLPSQTEISLNFVHNGTSVQRVIDLSYTPNNKIVFKNLHN